MKAIFVALIVCAIGIAHLALGPTAKASTETVLYSFRNDADGGYPAANVINVKGVLYGTTTGKSGAVFSLNRKTGAETVLHSFGSGTDGTNPQADLISVNGMLYGTTEFGGGCNNHGPGCGVVFSLDPGTSVETVLHSFQNDGKDGTDPVAGLIDVDGQLYGTTKSGGGNCQCGTVFSLNPRTGTYRVRYSFGTHALDGGDPAAGLIDVKGQLYGTTLAGGAGMSCACGTVFSFNPKTGRETVLYSFCSLENCADGSGPVAGLIAVKGVLYGTTYAGGAAGCSGYPTGCGTVFAIDPNTGAETVLYSFQDNGVDGNAPEAGLINVKDTLYGTTSDGGGADRAGVVFSVNLQSGTEELVHSFAGWDGGNPAAGLIDVKGVLYGTTYAGGAYYSGTVFSFVP